MIRGFWGGLALAALACVVVVVVVVVVDLNIVRSPPFLLLFPVIISSTS